MYSISEWLETVIQQCDKTPIIVVGSKLDMEQTGNSFDIIRAEAQYFASSNELTYFEVSSKNGKNIDKLLDSIVSHCILPPSLDNTIPTNKTRKYLVYMLITGFLCYLIKWQFNDTSS